MAAASAIGALIGATHDGTVFPLVWTMAACAALVAGGAFRLALRLPSTKRTSPKRADVR